MCRSGCIDTVLLRVYSLLDDSYLSQTAHLLQAFNESGVGTGFVRLAFGVSFQGWFMFCRWRYAKLFAVPPYFWTKSEILITLRQLTVAWTIIGTVHVLHISTLGRASVKFAGAGGW